MILIYSLIDLKTIKKVLIFLFFILPVYIISNGVNANTHRIICSEGESSLLPNYFYLSATVYGESGLNCLLKAVVPEPIITVQPAGTTICSGANHTLSVTATNDTPGLLYQWFSSTDNSTFTAVSGATAATYITPALTQTTYYKVTVSTNGNELTITSVVAPVVVLSDILITKQPILRTNICSGSSATLNVKASGGSGNYNYQWKNSTALTGPFTTISGANSASYTTPALTQNTFYVVEISDTTQGCDPVTSNVSVVMIPGIIKQPVTPSIVCVGGTVSLSATASANGGSATFNYQWQSSVDGVTGWTNVSGGTGSSTTNYTSGGLTGTTYYRAVITSSNPKCTLITDTVIATVIPGPAITMQPIGGAICEGGTFTMSSAAANGSGNFTYQWQKSLDGLTGWANVTNGTGANTTTYTTGPVSLDTFYRLKVIDSGFGCGITNSNPAKVDIFESPVINTQPVDGKVCINQTNTFTVVASGNILPGNIVYQWQTAALSSGPYFNVTEGTGGTTASYTTPAYPTAGNRYFRVLISQSQAGCRTISNLVTLNVSDIAVAPIGSVTQQPSCEYAYGTISVSNPDLGKGYEYSIDGVNFQTSNIFTNLASGIKQISVRKVGLNTCISPETEFTIFNRLCAVPESFASISGDSGGNTGTHTILDADLLSGVILNPADVTVTVNSISSYLTFNAVTNTITVLPGTPADYYTLNYTICENANPSNCSAATEIIQVTTSGIDAITDIVPGILNGSIENLAVVNVLTNDKLVGVPATTSNVQISVVHPALPVDPTVLLVPVLNTSTGNVDVPAGTVTGTYEIEYKICELAASGNCDTARIVISVGVAHIDANDDKIEKINGALGRLNVINAIENDELNNVPISGATFNTITITQELAATPLYAGANVPLFSTTTGNVSVPEGTPAKTYFITYHVCEKLNPVNCSDASIAIVVDASPLIANDDTVNNINGFEGAGNVINVYANNDFFNGAIVNISLAGFITPKILSPATSINGGPVPELVVSTGRVNIPAGTPAGKYQIKYQLCEDLNYGNCDDAIITINVIAPTITTTDDLIVVNGHSGKTNLLFAYDNDLLNGGTLDLNTVNATVISGPGAINGGPIPSFDTATGGVSVPPLTPAGEYKFVYKICEKLNPNNCDDAIITIVVVAAPIVAEDDVPFEAVNGFTGNPNTINALDNDTLDGVLVNPSEVEINVLIPATSINGNPVPILNPLTGNVNVPAGTAAGSYFITYRLTEKLNLTNNDTAVIIIDVVAATIEANNDTAANINGYIETANAINVLTNDTLNGLSTNLNQVTITVDDPAQSINGGLVPVLQPLTGIIRVTAGTPEGNYEIKYHICEKINPANCNDAIAFINVVGAPINAVDDDISSIPVNGFAGAANVVNALTNDTLNGIAIIPSQVSISNVIPASAINGGAIPVLDATTGYVSIPEGTAAGTYFITYRLNENMNPSNFDTATIKIVVTAPTIVANNDSVTNIDGCNGANDVINAITNDRLNRMDIPLIKIDITYISTTMPADYISGNPIPVLNALTGNVNVPAGTSKGTYTIRYRICEKLNPSNCSEATIILNVSATIIDANNDFAGAINGYTGANNVVNALTNDQLNGTPVQTLQIDIHSINTIVPATSTNGIVPALDLPTGNVNVPAGTSAGTYTIQYEICEKLNSGNCSQSIIVVIVEAPQIAAEDDLISNVEGYPGAPEVVNALTSNDKYNRVFLSNINLVKSTIISPATPIDGGAVPFFLPATGLVTIPPRTPAGSYQIKYVICDRLNPLNCDEATITILVVVPPIVANDDFIDNINGNSGANNVLNAYDNDTLDGNPITILNSTGTLVSGPTTINGAPVPVFNASTGNVDVPAGTHAGEYFIVYKICGKLNPFNCDDAVIRIRVVPAPIDAVNDTTSGINGFVGTINAINVLNNDTLNGILVNPAAVLITNVIPATAIKGGALPVLDPATGIVNVPAGTTPGVYTIRYTLREMSTISNNDTATVTIVVAPLVIEANDDILANSTGYIATNNAVDVLVNDTFNGASASLSNITITVDGVAMPINNGPVPILDPLTGKVHILAGTPAGNYEIKYHICENLSPANCNDATVYITIIATPILAVNDLTTNVNGYTGANNVINAITNDLLNGVAVQLTQININSLHTATPADYITGNPVPVLNTQTGSVDVPAGTSAGTYTIRYSICEKLNPTNCSEANSIVVVNAAKIMANDDTNITVNGYTGNPNALNVLDNDSFNDSSIDAKKVKVVAINSNQITITILDPAAAINGNPNVPVLDPATGIISVPPLTPAGLYKIQYRIAENLNSSNFDDATVFITVTTAAIEANNDTVLNINGFNGQANVVNAITTDKLNGVAMLLSEITIGVVTQATPINAGPIPTLDVVLGQVNVPAGTSTGTYTIRYSVCENLNPTNCSQADIMVSVISGPIIANDDAATGINGLDGAANVINILTNDVLENVAPTLSQVKITVLSPANPISGAIVPILDAATGLVSVPAGTSSGIYTIVYSICENQNAVNCDQAVIKISVLQPGVTLVKQGVFSDTNGDGYAQPGELIRYSFRITNTGTIDLTNVTITDPKATITGTPIATLATGQFNTTSYTGTYVITQADINAGFVVNQALVRAQPAVGTAIQNLSDSNDPTLIGNHDPTITPVFQFKDLTLLKAGQLTGNGDVGSLINYSFTVKNTGNVPLTNVTITDPMLTTTSIPVTPGTLAPGATGTATASYTVKATDVANGEVINTAFVIGDDPQGKPVTAVSDSTDPTLAGDDDPTVIDLTLRPAIALIKTALFNDENKNGYAEIGESVTYRFAVTNTGNVDLANIVVKDPKPGITISGDPISLKQDESNATAFVANYVLTTADIDAGLVENQAEVTALSANGLTVKDLSDDNSTSEDNPTILPLNACKVTIHNAFSPDGDGKNEIFKIDGIECYANAYVQIYDRWGVLVYDAYNYDNNAVAFRGISEGRATINKQKGLPDGTYFYVITYTTYLNEPVSKTGYLYMSGKD